MTSPSAPGAAVLRADDPLTTKEGWRRFESFANGSTIAKDSNQSPKWGSNPRPESEAHRASTSPCNTDGRLYDHFGENAGPEGRAYHSYTLGTLAHCLAK